MNHNMRIYRRLNPKLLVQVEVGLGQLHWANMSNISLTKLTPALPRVGRGGQREELGGRNQ